MERFVAVLIEHTAGKFPLWLTPDQAVVLPISEKSNEYAWKVKEILEAQDVRVIVDDRNEKLGRKIRDNELKRIPYMLIVGEKEAEEGKVSVRRQGGEASGQPAPAGDGSMTIQEFADFINENVKKQMAAY
jgi:threonyl-tRNA synthetase